MTSLAQKMNEAVRRLPTGGTDPDFQDLFIARCTVCVRLGCVENFVLSPAGLIQVATAEPTSIFSTTHRQNQFCFKDLSCQTKSHCVSGTPAPDFTLPATTGGTVTLSDFRGRSEVVVFFYPKDNSPACSLEACSFRDSYDAFREAGAEVVGISTDSIVSHDRFATRLRLPFLLLSDSDGFVRSRYGVQRTMGIFPGRATFLIDREGIIRHIFSSQFLPLKHVPEMLAVLRNLHEKKE